MTVTVESANQELKAAQGQQQRLLRALQAGDTKITGADLAEADSAVRIAALRAEAAQQLAAEDAERVRQARIAEFEQLIQERFGEHEGSVVAAFDEAVSALGPLVTAVQSHNAGLAEIVDELLSLQPLPPGIDPQRGNQGIHLSTVDVRVAPIDVSVLLAEATWRALTAAGEAKATAVVEPLAHISRDRQTNAYLGIEEPDPSTPPKPAGPSDWLRRVARIVAERTA